MNRIGNIHLSWRKGRGFERALVGVIRKNNSEGIRFNYIEKEVKKAMQDGFTAYTDFPEVTKEYTENVLDIFGQRLTKPERSDIRNYYDFWEIEPEFKDDKYYLLALTQGLLATDNFEFLADYYPTKEMKFISEICGLTYFKLEAGLMAAGDELRWEIDPKNEHDPNAVKVFKGTRFLGYIKKIHSVSKKIPNTLTFCTMCS